MGSVMIRRPRIRIARGGSRPQHLGMDQAALETALQVTSLLLMSHFSQLHLIVLSSYADLALLGVLVICDVVCRTSLSTWLAWSLGLGHILDYRYYTLEKCQ